MSEILDLTLQEADLNIGHFNSIVKVFNDDQRLSRNSQILAISYSELVLSYVPS